MIVSYYWRSASLAILGSLFSLCQPVRAEDLLLMDQQTQFDLDDDDDDDEVIEWIPLYLAISSLVFTFTFTAWAIVWIGFIKDSGESHNNDDTQVPLDTDDTTQKGYRSDPSEEELLDETKSQVMISWSGITCSYKTETGGQDKVTLENAHGVMRGGELTAVLGASGSGKSTLMNILAGRKGLGTVSGTMSVLGQHITDLSKGLEVLNSTVAYVPQSEAFFPMQTPMEAVEFRAKLVHGKDGVSQAEIISILEEVGLGDPGLYSRSIGGELAGGFVIPGLSGGEKKRLALACALISRPSFLMLDEITSGLDSENAFAVMELVKRVCIDFDVSALVVIHQPSGYIWQTFDRVILLANGHCVFSDAVNCNNDSRLEMFYNTHLHKAMPASKHELPLDLLKELKEPRDYNLSNNHEIVPSVENPEALKVAKIPTVYKLQLVFQRNLLNQYVRNPTNLLARLFMYTICPLLGGALFWKVVDKADATSTVIGGLLFSLLGDYLLPFATISTFTIEKQFFVSEQALGLYSPWIYCASQLLVEMWVLLFAALLQTSIIVPMYGAWHETLPGWATFLNFYSVYAMSGLVGSSIVLFCCAIVSSQDLAFILGSGYVTVALGMSGGFVPFRDIEYFISWVQWISPCKYSLQGLILVLYKGTDTERFLEVIQLDRPGTISGNLGALCLMYTLFALATVLVLSNVREKR